MQTNQIAKKNTLVICDRTRTVRYRDCERGSERERSRAWVHRNKLIWYTAKL